jgi:hypothetical protein
VYSRYSAGVVALGPRRAAFDLGGVLQRAGPVAIVVGSHHSARRAFQEAFGGMDRASQSRQQRKVNNKRMLGELLSVM